MTPYVKGFSTGALLVTALALCLCVWMEYRHWQIMAEWFGRELDRFVREGGFS